MSPTTGTEIAIIGMSCRLPGAADPTTFWHNLCQGVESISFFDSTELEPSVVVGADLHSHPDFVPAGGALDRADEFDHDLFGIAPREASWMDPQQRVFLELAWAALEDAAYDPARFVGRIAVYAGASTSEHLLRVLDQLASDPASAYEALGGAAAQNLATRVSFQLGLRGESVTVHTACSTGLAAVHMACQSLLLGQSGMAVAGAVSLSVPQRTGYLYQDGMILSPDGHCRAFDHRAAGTVASNGAGVVVLKPLADALADGDQIHAVIRGSAINNEGHRSIGYTAPSVAAQAEVVTEALAFAGVSAADVGYVEAHGTGTPLGDPIEIAALTRAFRRGTDRVGDCLIGSVKTNIGHLDTAAGIAGLIKAALMVRHAQIPPSLHFERPNPGIDFGTSPFTVNTELRQWERVTRIAGVSSFGIGGTNVHAVVAQPPEPPVPAPSSRAHQLITLSAHTRTALATMAAQLADALEQQPAPILADIAYTRAVGRAALRHRRTVVAADLVELVTALRADTRAEPAVVEAPRAAMLFPGQGAAQHGMAAGLYESEPAFRAELDSCLEQLEPLLGAPLRPALLSGDGAVIDDPAVAHPALFAVEYALARLWLSWGVRPVALLGHSFGEYAAACVAGVFTLADAAALVVARGRLVATMPPGAMLAVGLDEDGVAPYLRPALSLAAVNGDGRCVVSGPPDEVADLRVRLATDGHASVALPVSKAFHSADVEPFRAELATVVAGRSRSTPELPLLSSLSGTWWAPGDGEPDYWSRQLREPVRFGAALDCLAGGDDRPLLLIEVGPGQALTALARAQLGTRATVVPSLRRAGDAAAGHRTLLEAVGRAWRAGVAINWDAFYGTERRARVALPGYPFEGGDCRLVVPARRRDRRDVPEPRREPERSVTPMPDGQHPDGPRDEIERTVYEIWRERLGVDQFSVHDNFLELGGNSLMAAQLITRLRAAFPVPIPLGVLFEEPTVAGVAGRIRTTLGDTPPPSQGHGAPIPELPPLRPVARDGELPLSVVQARTLALTAADPANPALTMPVAVELSGVLDHSALQRAMTAVVARHETLRTTFHQAGDRWTQRIEPAGPVPVEVTELTGSLDERRAAAAELARAEPSVVFDLRVSPLRVRLLRLADDHHVLLLTMHHVVSDTLSVVLLVQEIAAGYATAGERPAADPLTVQYADFAAWQRGLLDTGALRRQADYWRDQLADLPPPLALPTDAPRSAEHGVRGHQVAVRLPAELSEQVRQTSRRLGVTPFVLLLAAYAALLSRVSGARDIVIGTPVGNRDRAELEPIIGYVAHALPLRIDLHGDPSFTELVARAQQALLGAHANRDLPYEEMVTQLRPDLDIGRSRVFDALLVLHAGIPEERRVGGLTWRVWPVADMPAMFGATLAALTLQLADSPAGLSGAMEYAEELFEADTIDRLFDQFTTLLHDAAGRPERRLSELCVDRSPWPAAQTAAPPHQPVPARVLARASAWPGQVAITDPDGTLTWAELINQAAAAAGLLRQVVAEPHPTVWVDLPSSTQRIAVVLGALLAGATVALPSPGGVIPDGAWRLGTGLAGDRTIDLAAAPESETSTPVWSFAADQPALCESGPDGQWRVWTHDEVARYVDGLAATAPTPAADRPGMLVVEADLTAPALLEILWALATAGPVHLRPTAGRGSTLTVPRWLPSAARDPRPVRFSLSYFANDEDAVAGPKYRLLLEGARLADQAGLAAVWTPERHFHSFGGLYPSPTATSAALAAATSRIGIRAGSVVLPLHDPVRIAEDWAVIDNLSGGRAGVSFASGWHPNDFVLSRTSYADRREVMFEGIDLVRRLWRGETVERVNGTGERVEVAIRPRPVQPELPFWLTAAGSPDTFRVAGAMGGYVLTNLMAQSLDDLAPKIELYRQAWRDAGHPGRGHLTLMLHTFLDEDTDRARQQVREPLLRYFRSSVGIAAGFAASQGMTIRPADLSEEDLTTLLEHGLERYLDDGGLFGAPEACAAMVDTVRELDVDEIAALIDFGLPDTETLRGVELLGDLAEREAHRARIAQAAEARRAESSLADLASWLDQAGVGAVAAAEDTLAALAEAHPEVLAGRAVLLGDHARLPANDREELLGLVIAAAGPVTVRHRLPDRTPLPARATDPAARTMWLAGATVVDQGMRELGVGVVGDLVTASGQRTGQLARIRPDGGLDLIEPPPVKAVETASGAGIRPARRDQPLPLSYAQQRLWYLDRLVPHNVAYNNAVALRLTGTLRVSALHRALNEVVRRHEALRTTFHATTDGAEQVIHPDMEIDLPVTTVASESEVDRVAAEHARIPFDLEHGPLVRARLLSVAADHHVLVLSMHHIVSDGWSAGVLLGELDALYAAFAADEPSPLPPLTVQYADYAVWQRGHDDTATSTRELAYWRDTLAGAPMLELPVDRPRPAVAGSEGARSPVRIDRETAEALGRLCRQAGVTVYMGLHAALATVLHRYSGQTDLVVGTAVAGRNQPETERLVGCFINTVAVRTDLSGDPTFSQVLDRVKDAALGALAHQETPFERLVDELKVPRTLSHSPLYQAMMVLHNTPSPRMSLGGLVLEIMDLDPGTAKLDLVLELREGPDGIGGAFEYNIDLFEPATVDRLAGHLVTLLASVVADPDRRLSDLPMTSPAEQTRLLEWSTGPALPDSCLPSTQHATVHEAFAAQATATPGAVAVADEDGTLTYAELAARARALAGALCERGVQPGQRVVVCAPRPVEAITAMLGVLAAGAAYVPVDPHSPSARRSALITQARPMAILTGEGHQEDLGTVPAHRIAELTAHQPGEPLAVPAGPGDPAYVIFTSGSTGRPKAVVVEHRHLLASTRARRAHYGPPGRCLNLYALTFDGSVAWIYFALLTGGTVWCVRPDVAAEPHQLAELIAQERITRLATVPGLYGQLLAAASPDQLSSLESVTVGGEACLPDLVRAHADALPDTQLHNEYGPTEATVWSTVHRVGSLDTGRVPIGRPIPGGRAYVLDAARQLVPPGGTGELYVGGAALARGYLDAVELTSSRFVPDPWESDVDGARLYRTGDRARWNSRGELEFLGRADRQVKIRGFRVEPAEIEAVLAAHPSVREAAVIAVRDRAGDRLTGYLAPVSGAELDVDQVRAFAQARLPDYLLPAHLIAVPALPRTRHGKLDSDALPQPHRPVDQTTTTPRTAVERTLVTVVAEVLRLPEVGIHEDFFSLGGDSILGMGVVTRARQQGVKISVRQLFQNPTVAGLAAVAGTRLAVRADQGPVTGPVPLTPVQRWFFGQGLPEPAHWNMSVQLELTDHVRPDLLQEAFRTVLHHHDALRLRFVRHGGTWGQHNAPAEPTWTLDTLDLTALPVPQRQPALEAMAASLQSGLNLAEGPLLRAALVTRQPTAPDLLLLVAHHLVTDGVSLRIILGDLFEAYRQRAVDEPVSLQPKTTSYAEWARAITQFPATPAAQAELDYWRTVPFHLAPRLPRDGTAPNVHGRAATVRHELDEADTKALLHGSPAEPHDVLVASVAAAVSTWTGSPHVQLDIERHGREDLIPGLDVVRTVGWFSDFHPVLLTLPREGDAQEQLATVSEQLRSVPHNGAGFIPLRHGGHPSAATLATLPVSEITVNYLGRLDAALPAGAPATVIGDLAGSLRADSTPRPYLIEVTAGVLADRLWLVWTFTDGIHTEDTIRTLAGHAERALQELVRAWRT